MKVLKTLMFALIAGAVSFGAMAAQEITNQADTADKVKVGTVSAKTENGKTTAKVKKELSDKADAQGALYFMVITEGQVPDNAPEAKADTFKDKK